MSICGKFWEIDKNDNVNIYKNMCDNLDDIDEKKYKYKRKCECK